MTLPLSMNDLPLNDLAFVVASLLVAAAMLAALALHDHSAGARSRFEARTLADLQRLARSHAGGHHIGVGYGHREGGNGPHTQVVTGGARVGDTRRIETLLGGGLWQR